MLGIPNIRLKFFTCLGLFALLTGQVRAQNPAGSKIVTLIRADSLAGTVVKGVQLKKLIGNVALQQGNVLLYSDLVLQDENKNTLQAFGNVRIIQGDSVTLTGDTALYYGNSRLAKMTGRTVVLNDGTIMLTTRRLDYNMNTHVAVYSGGGTIIDKQSILTSRDGTYNTETKLFTYRNDVRIVDPERVITADSLRYSALSKDAFFIAPTKIASKSDTVFANGGSYNVASQISNIQGRSTVRTDKIDLTADTLNYDKPTQIGIARGNVVFIARTDSTVLTGNVGRYFGTQGITRVWGDAVLRNIRQNDTLYLSADTLLSREIYVGQDTIRRLFAYRNVLIFKRDFQAKCDSLAYYVNDSTLFFYKKPILWSTGNQSEGDSVQLKMKNGKLNTVILRGHAFVVSRDSLLNFNQMKGRRITTYLNPDSKLERVFVEGNGESIYYALDEKNKLVGLNRSESSKMTLHFREGEVKRIAYVGKPEQSLIPPPKITEDNRILDGFNWRENLRPNREKVLRNRPPLIPFKTPTKAITPVPVKTKQAPKKPPVKKRLPVKPVTKKPADVQPAVVKPLALNEFKVNRIKPFTMAGRRSGNP
ncbi:MAG: hypothetical protein LH606_14115 [Cytophagaceae bacterium]|nr:hypothetical protein [Cytophagaceae bacterium]